jgi:excisionase family DNA binding protein
MTIQPMKRIPSKDAAAYLQVSRKTLLEWIKQDRISHFRVGRRVTFTQQQLDRFIQESERPREVA